MSTATPASDVQPVSSPSDLQVDRRVAIRQPVVARQDSSMVSLSPVLSVSEDPVPTSTDNAGDRYTEVRVPCETFPADDAARDIQDKRKITKKPKAKSSRKNTSCIIM